MNAFRASFRIQALIIAIILAVASCSHKQAQQLIVGGPASGARTEFSGEPSEPMRVIPTQAQGVGSGFGGFIGQLRREGLDIVLAIPRSGSSVKRLDDLKSRTAQTITAIQRLVPSARLAIVAYGGNREQLETVALRYSSSDDLVKFLAALRMHRSALPSEAVAGALRAAVDMLAWDPKSHRIVVLFAESVGGPKQAAEMIELARKFHATGGTVNTVDIAPASAQRTPSGQATAKALRSIANAAGGSMLPLRHPTNRNALPYVFPKPTIGPLANCADSV